VAADLHDDLVEAAFILVVGVVADGVLAVQLFARFLDGFFQTALAVKAEFAAASSLGENFDRVVLGRSL